MSRVKNNQKYMNLSKHNAEDTNPTKIKRIHGKNEDYTKAGTITSWLFMKYDMTYSQYKHKSKNRREALRKEYEKDTNIVKG